MHASRCYLFEISSLEIVFFPSTIFFVINQYFVPRTNLANYGELASEIDLSVFCKTLSWGRKRNPKLSTSLGDATFQQATVAQHRTRSERTTHTHTHMNKQNVRFARAMVYEDTSIVLSYISLGFRCFLVNYQRPSRLMAEASIYGC